MIHVCDRMKHLRQMLYTITWILRIKNTIPHQDPHLTTAPILGSPYNHSILPTESPFKFIILHPVSSNYSIPLTEPSFNCTILIQPQELSHRIFVLLQYSFHRISAILEEVGGEGWGNAGPVVMLELSAEDLEGEEVEVPPVRYFIRK